MGHAGVCCPCIPKIKMAAPRGLPMSEATARKKKRMEWWQKHGGKASKNTADYEIKTLPSAQVVRPQCSGDGVKETAYHVHESCESVHAFDGGAKAERRYILFVGNLPYGASREDILEHFHKAGVPALDFRLLTKRNSGDSRGCGFLELKNLKAYQNALKLNHAKMADRRIKIELTCGGGGKGEERQSKIKERNVALAKSRKKKLKKRQLNKASATES